MALTTQTDGGGGTWFTRARAAAAVVAISVAGVTIVALQSSGNLYQGTDNPWGIDTYQNNEFAKAGELHPLGDGGTYGPVLSNEFTQTVAPVDNGAGSPASFEIQCAPSHWGFDDPTRNTGNPGSADLMMFIGNTETNAYSTVDGSGEARNDLFESGGGTCQPGALNRSAYYTPAMLDGAPNGSRQIVVPKEIVVRYTSERPGDTQRLPVGLVNGAGNIAASGAPGTTLTVSPDLSWGCHDPAVTGPVNTSTTIAGTGGVAECPNNWDIQSTIVFSQCVATDSGQADGNPTLFGTDFYDHVEPLANDSDPCPGTEPYRIPQLTLIIRYDNPGSGGTAEWRLSTDDQADTVNPPTPGGSLHAINMSAWHPAAQDAWINGCITQVRDCTSGQTGLNSTGRRFVDITGPTITSQIFDGPYLIDDPSDGPYGEASLPAPITPSSNVFAEILDDYPSGGLIVIPNGEYVVGDLDNLDPTSRLTVVAESRNGVQIVRTSDTIGETDFWIKNSSNITFAGIWFRDIVTVLSTSQDIEFRYTKHSYPIEAHPDPTNSYCGNNQGPNGIEINGTSDNIDFYGIDIDGIGDDGFKVVQSDNVDLVGAVITDINHGYLQAGNTNGICGSNDGDNYHYDGIQFVNGSVDNFTVSDSYVGRRIVMQVEDGDDSNLNVTLNNVWLMSESTPEDPAEYDCVTMLTRVTAGANAGAQQTMTTNDLVSYCDPTIGFSTHWVATSNRANGVIVNGTAIDPSNTFPTELFDFAGDRNADITRSPAAQWRRANPYQAWVESVAP